MGSDVSGRIAFGIPTSDELPLRQILRGAVKDEDGYWDEVDDDTDEDDRYFTLKSGNECPNYETDHDGWEKWHDERREFLKDSPIDIMISGYDDNLGSNIIIKETQIESDWGSAVVLKPFETKPEWIVAIKDYCETMGVPYQEPVWFLTSLYF